jgi:hypothetical protein
MYSLIISVEVGRTEFQIDSPLQVEYFFPLFYLENILLHNIFSQFFDKHHYGTCTSVYQMLPKLPKFQTTQVVFIDLNTKYNNLYLITVCNLNTENSFEN